MNMLSGMSQAQNRPISSPRVDWSTVLTKEMWALGTKLKKAVINEHGGVSGTVHEQKKYRITDYGHKNFVFPNHENRRVRYTF